jgi:homoserine acetyltransferase
MVGALQRVGADVTFAEIESPYGHDAFLLEPEAQTEIISPFLDSLDGWMMRPRDLR